MALHSIDPEAERELLDALDELHEAEEEAKEAKTRVGAAKKTLELKISRAGLERALVVNGRVVSAKVKPTASDGPLLRKLRDER